MNIPLIRLLNQQIMAPQFKTPAQVVSWMGAVQAQDATAMKWAVGLRMKSPGKSLVEQALNEGTVVRTHVMRPTWHLVTAENLRWMLMLSRESNERAYRSYLHASGMHIDETTFEKALDCMGLALEGGHSLTAKDLQDVIEQRGLPHTDRHVRAYLWLAECRALVCSGTLQGNKNTYALVDERISPQPSTTREEALTRLAHNYFRSHSPATVEDFVWWSGLKTSEARQAIGAVGQDLVTEKYRDATYYIHTTCRTHGRAAQATALLPAFEEYLLGYKDRTAVLPREFYPKAFTGNGIFFPVIMHSGQLVGTWKRPKAATAPLDYTCFRPHPAPGDEALDKALQRYRHFLTH